MISQPDDDGMDGMYPSDSAESETTSTETETETPETIDEENEENATKTALVPKSMCGGCKVGGMMKMRVVADHGDEMELEPVSESKTETTEMSDDEEIDALNKA